MEIHKREIVNFYELDKKWQEEAKRNLGEYAEEESYLRPDEDQDPEEHVLWDLTSCMRHTGEHEGFEFNSAIAISNNSTILLKFDDNMEEVSFIFV